METITWPFQPPISVKVNLTVLAGRGVSSYGSGNRGQVLETPGIWKTTDYAFHSPVNRHKVPGLRQMPTELQLMSEL
jgi:hypothetical protein